MKQILINKSIAYSAKVGGGTISGINEVNLLDTGAIAFFTEHNVMLDPTSSVTVATQMEGEKAFYVVVGNQQTNADAKSYISTLIPIRASYKKQAYVAPVKQRSFIGYDGTTAGTALNFPTLIAGQSAFIRITDTTPGLLTLGTMYDNEIKRYEYIVRTGDTATIIITALRDMINNDLDSIVTATNVGSTTGLKLDANNFGTTFAISIDGIFLNSTIVTPTSASHPGVSIAVNYGEGTEAQVSALELLYSTERGNTNQYTMPQLWYKNPTMVTSGGTYDIYTLSWDGKRSISVGEQNTVHFDILIPLIHSSTQQTNVETIFNTIFTDIYTNIVGDAANLATALAAD